VNSGYAMFTRIEDAAANKAVGGHEGVFETGDLMTAVRKGDRSVRKGAFARGDALMQDWAETAHSVLRPEGRNYSGTAGAMKQGSVGRHVGEVAGAAAGGIAGHGLASIPLAAGGALAGRALGNVIDLPIAAATNALARHGIEKAARAAARQGAMVPHNYLKAITARTSPLVHHAAPVLGGTNMLRAITAPQPQSQ